MKRTVVYVLHPTEVLFVLCAAVRTYDGTTYFYTTLGDDIIGLLLMFVESLPPLGDTAQRCARESIR